MSNRFTMYESTWKNVDAKLIKESCNLLDLDGEQNAVYTENGVEMPVPSKKEDECLLDLDGEQNAVYKENGVEIDPFEEFFNSQEPYEPSPYNGDYFEDLGESTSWGSISASKIKESLALPGGMLNAEPTEYEKELDKHNQARKNNKVANPEVIGDPDCGEIGVHDFKDSGAPTDVKEKVKTDIKATELKPNKGAVEVNQKKKWDD